MKKKSVVSRMCLLLLLAVFFAVCAIPAGCGSSAPGSSDLDMAAKAAIAYDIAMRDLDREALTALRIPEEGSQIAEMFNIIGDKADALRKANAGDSYEVVSVEIEGNRAIVKIKTSPSGNEHARVLYLIDGAWRVKNG